MERFSVFFTDKIATLRSEIDKLPSRCLAASIPEDPSCTCTSSVFEPVSSDAVRKEIMKAPPKSCSLDPLPTSRLKTFIDKLLPCITSIINLSLGFGEFPSSLKHGLMTPLLKNADADPNDLKSYRPITNLTFLGKTIERIVAL